MALFFSRSRLTQLTTIALWVAVIYGCLQLFLHQFNVSVLPSTWWKDYLFHLVIGIGLFTLCRSFWFWAVAYTLFITLLQVCNALKLVILGSPIMPDDFLAVRNMFHLFDGWRLAAMWLMLLLPIIALLFAIKWSAPRSWIAILVMVVFTTGFFHWSQPVSEWMDHTMGDWVWDQPSNYKDRGLLMHIVHESARNSARGKVSITSQKAKTAFATLSQGVTLNTAAKIKQPRNVYALLLESFWDPMLLTAAGISQDPLDPRFRKLWKQTHYSKIMAPVFGGYTANSEFELLCGFPVSVDAVFFEGWLRNDAPCLPRYLANAGYHTIAAHPNYAAFWNRVNAYNRIGFTSYWAQPEFALDDMNREFLSDVSLYRQMWEKIQPDLKKGTPIFTHIVTFFGHMDYPLNELRPKKITVMHDPNMVEEYVNLMYYKSRELMDFIELLQKEDPTALIILYGDHLPFLGPNYDGYVESGLLKRSKGEFTPDMFNTYVSTPLIIIDGKKGPLSAGQLPIYQLPSIVLRLLGDTGNSFVNLTQHPPFSKIRPLPGITLVINDQNKTFTCEQHTTVNTTADCGLVNEWFSQIMTVNTDIFSGKQHSLH